MRMTDEDSPSRSMPTGAPLSYESIRSVKREVLDAVIGLGKFGLTWNAIAVMRDVCRTTYRYAGGPDGGATRRTGLSRYRYGIGSVLKKRRNQLDLALFLSLYAAYDPCLNDEGAEVDVLVDPHSLWLAWTVFTRMVPDSELKIVQGWIGARAILQGSFSLLACQTCETVLLEGSHNVDSDECEIRGCYVCDRRSQQKSLMTVRAVRTARNRSTARTTPPGRSISGPDNGGYRELATGR